MNRFFWNSSWDKPVQQWCDLGHRMIHGACWQRHSVPEFLISSAPTVRWNDINRRRFTIIDNTIERTPMALALQEEASIERIINFATELSRDGTSPPKLKLAGIAREIAEDLTVSRGAQQEVLDMMDEAGNA